ncbi:MAG: LLM class flavin-dependent oxidoreductase [Actinocatenispora sp.]
MSVVILPIYPWARARSVWQRAEELGCHAAYTYDHLSWRQFRDGPWFGAVPTLTAAATATERLRLGTLVTSPNFRHPVTLAKDLMSLDDISGGRLTVGVGAGGTGFDATVLGQQPWSAAERADRFGEFVPLLDQLLREPVTDHTGRFYAAHEARMVPGCVQRPRAPFLIAATGRRGLALAARYGQGWVTGAEDPSDQLTRLAAACTEAGRDPAELRKVVMTGFGADDPPTSVDAVVERAGRYKQHGVSELVVHWPVPDSQFDLDQGLFERILTEVPYQVG